MRFFSSKILNWSAFLILSILFIWAIYFFFFQKERKLNYTGIDKNIVLDDNGLDFNLSTQADTIKDFLKEKNINLSEHDQIFPEINSQLFPGINIKIYRAVKIKIEVDGKKIDSYTTAKNIIDAIGENNITLGRLDKVAPEKFSSPQNDQNIVITRINVEEKAIQEDIDFKITVKNNNKLSWREKKIETPGVKGIKETIYKLTYKNGKEISRVKLSQKIIREPTTQKETQGTYVKVGKADKGQATWYAYKGGMFAASTTIPKGEYAKVTSLASGKSIIVQINDYGPQGKGRIIDLDKVAFQKLAPIGAGVIGVKVERILN